MPPPQYPADPSNSVTVGPNGQTTEEMAATQASWDADAEFWNTIPDKDRHFMKDMLARFPLSGDKWRAFAKWWTGLAPEMRSKYLTEEWKAAGSGAQLLWKDYVTQRNGATDAAAGAAATGAERNGILDRLKAFIEEMGSDVGGPGKWTDPVASTLANVGASQAGLASSRSGLQGPLSNAAGAANVQQAVLPWLQQRNQMRQQALGLATNYDLGLGDLSMRAQQLQDQRDTAMWAGQKDQAQGLGALVGGIPGAVLSMFNPAAGAVVSQFGSRLGAAANGNSVPAYPTYRSTNYKPGTGW